MMLILTILFIAGLTIAIIEIARRRNPDTNLAWLPFLASLPVPGLFVIYWLFSLWWIQSDHCADVQICNSGGISAMSVGAAVGVFGSFFVSMTTSILWINWRNRK
ncbi:MAG: hypothetical protein GW808_11030 [Sphingomonadales bacterium]|nr:hypothetical protein [Sphingomonadales bacterium]NCO48599.1 hypothetical protein [Sphingomonadales bacterium]NCO98707.1 hypothetical protein [Sphingomonadales bacterium]NCP28293.1 hypothetical protein [Sphingomonadales bacterium]NCP43645.1 hypothetical protein [Sphingomonadales bacterium]